MVETAVGMISQSLAFVFHHFTGKLWFRYTGLKMRNYWREIDFFVKHFVRRFCCFTLAVNFNWNMDTCSQNRRRVMKTLHGRHVHRKLYFTQQSLVVWLTLNKTWWSHVLFKIEFRFQSAL